MSEPLVVKARVRFVEQEQVRVMDDGHRQTNPLPLTEGDAVDSPIGEIGDRRRAEGPFDRRPSGTPAKQGCTRGKFEVLASRQPWIQTSVTGHEQADTTSEGRSWRHRVKADGAPVRREEPCRDPQKRRLAGPVLPAEPEDLAGGNVQRSTAKNLSPAKALVDPR